MKRLLVCAWIPVLLAGCAATEEGTGGPTKAVVGGATGAALGAALGSAVGGPDGWWLGALSGAAVGTATGAAIAEGDRERIPYAERGGPRGSRLYSPHSNAVINDPGYRPGSVIYDPNTGEPFRVP